MCALLQSSMIGKLKRKLKRKLGLEEPAISVVLPNYNGSDFLKKAVDSVLAQTFTDFELIVVEDGSTDQSAELLASYSDSRIRVIPLEQNEHICVALNTGLAAARGKYIARIDSDDCWLPNKLEKQYRPKQVIVEYNGMWSMERLYREGLPANWILYQIMCLVDARTFEMYVKNMGQLMMEKITNADMLIFDHCNEQLRAQLRSRNLRMVNRRADIYLENEDGTSEEYVTPEMSPFDLSSGKLDVPDEDYGIG